MSIKYKYFSRKGTSVGVDPDWLNGNKSVTMKITGTMERMMNDTDRIELAEWMGGYLVAVRSDGRVSIRWGDAEHGVDFDPYTNANDDYAVLEFMREQDWYPEKLPQYCFDRPLHSYVIGDYARAALQVKREG